MPKLNKAQRAAIETERKAVLATVASYAMLASQSEYVLAEKVRLAGGDQDDVRDQACIGFMAASMVKRGDNREDAVLLTDAAAILTMKGSDRNETQKTVYDAARKRWSRFLFANGFRSVKANAGNSNAKKKGARHDTDKPEAKAAAKTTGTVQGATPLDPCPNVADGPTYIAYALQRVLLLRESALELVAFHNANAGVAVPQAVSVITDIATMLSDKLEELAGINATYNSNAKHVAKLARNAKRNAGPVASAPLELDAA